MIIRDHQGDIFDFHIDLHFGDYLSGSGSFYLTILKLELGKFLGLT